MGGDVRHTTDSLTPAQPLTRAAVGAWLQQRAHEAWKYDYFAVMRRLECMAKDAPRWGHAPRPAMESVRVAHEPSMSFAPASVARFEPASDGGTARVRQPFFGYVGPNAPLPLHLAELVRERALNHGDPTLLAFLDALMHRFGLQFYRAWAQARPVTGMDRPGEDAFRRQIGAFVGIAGAARQQRDEIPDDARLHFSGWLARRVHNAESVEAVLGAYFNVPVRVENWLGHWMSLPDGEVTRIGVGNTNSASRMLGQGAVLGRKVWDRQHMLRVHLGPLTLAQYRQFLPTGSACALLQRWMQQLLGDEYEWDAAPVVRSGEVPVTRLGSGERGGNEPRLGWVAWLGSQPRSQDARGAHVTRNRATAFKGSER
ncbi:type VI secretion system baseplate subunit TssG [Diaphorobacter aerolatus]|uniref:Type VI secretion system baseplate subunit TssG n=1 Tax=Diaphorobacter aerolatus TaxID=1288495 RepID=A0A7H0GLK0_9BURK|nr:type VI secretion system baseplate subunit TssG [Diaphorobacter aerolatus]QNP49166.1 type VI secretion system baseplate subunit TssG [Diaphorobacter aerolatus]